MRNKKILFFDIDGTLLTEDTHIVPLSTKVALQKAKDKGHLVFINTGRPISTIDNMIKDLAPDGYVCGCGTYVTYRNKILYEKTLSQERCSEIVDLLKQTNVEAILEGKNAVYFDKQIKHPFLSFIKDRYINENFNVKAFTDTPITFDKFAVWFDEHADIERFKKGIPDFTYIVRGADFGEIVPCECSKATGIQFLSDHFEIPLDSCYVFGDSTNDESMLSYVKHAIVMGNGAPELFKHAYYVTKDIKDNGISHALEYLNLI